MRLLLTSGGVTNPSIAAALAELLGKPVEATNSLCIRTPSGGSRCVVPVSVHGFRLDTLGKMSFRGAGRMHHLGIGAAHAGTPVLAIADDTTVTIIELTTGEILATNTIDPTRTYWRNTQKNPGPMARGYLVEPMSRLTSHLCRDS